MFFSDSDAKDGGDIAVKIEMGESLFYSWLRHVKECQIVQTNWTTSTKWTLLHEDKLQEVMDVTDRYFREKFGYDIYKKTSSLSQLLRQAECDALGISVRDGSSDVYAVDVAFHENANDTQWGQLYVTPRSQ